MYERNAYYYDDDDDDGGASRRDKVAIIQRKYPKLTNEITNQLNWLPINNNNNRNQKIVNEWISGKIHNFYHYKQQYNQK